MASTTESGIATHHANNRANEGGFQVEKGLRNRDGFFKETYRFFDVLAHHRKAVFVGAVALIGACVAGGILANRHEAKSAAGMDALFLAQKSLETEMKILAGVKTPTPEAPALKDPKDAKAKEAAEKAKRAEEEASNKKLDELAFTQLDVDAKFPEAVKKYRDVISAFAGTRSAHEARMALGTLYFNHREPAKAAPIFQAASESAPGSFEKSLALQSWGYALENDGKLAEAVAAYEKALNYGEGGIKGDCWLAIARCQEALHDTAKARSTYDQILSQLPNTEAAKSAEALKAKLQ